MTSVDLDTLRTIGKRLGPDGLHRLLDDFYRRAAQDVLIGFFFDGKDLSAIAAKQAQFLGRAMGLWPTYVGKSPATAHLGLAPILAGHFDRRLRLLEETLRANGLSADEIQAWIGFEEQFRASIQTA